MADGGSIPPSYTKGIWDSILSVGDQVSTAWDSEQGNTVGDDCKSSKSVNAEKANTLGAVKVSMGRNFRFGSHTGAAVLA